MGRDMPETEIPPAMIRVLKDGFCNKTIHIINRREQLNGYSRRLIFQILILPLILQSIGEKIFY